MHFNALIPVQVRYKEIYLSAPPPQPPTHLPFHAADGGSWQTPQPPFFHSTSDDDFNLKRHQKSVVVVFSSEGRPGDESEGIFFSGNMISSSDVHLSFPVPQGPHGVRIATPLISLIVPVFSCIKKHGEKCHMLRSKMEEKQRQPLESVPSGRWNSIPPSIPPHLGRLQKPACDNLSHVGRIWRRARLRRRRPRSPLRRRAPRDEPIQTTHAQWGGNTSSGFDSPPSGAEWKIERG